MELKEYQELYKERIEKQVDEFIEEHGHEYVKPTPIDPIENQIERLRKSLKKKFTYEDFDLAPGLQIIFDVLPERISEEDWDDICWEFFMAEYNALDYFEDHENQESEDEQVSVTEALGLSEKTYEHVLELLFDFLKQEDYERALEISKVLLAFYHDKYPGWIGYARCHSWLGDDQKAIEIYQSIEEMFPQDPISRIFCAWSYLMVGEEDLAKEQAKEGEQLLMQEPEDIIELWKPVLETVKKALPKE